MIKWLYRNIVPLKIRAVIYHRYLNGGCRLPEPIFVEHVEKLKLIGQNKIRCAEVGVDKGSTTRAVLELLEANDQIDLYDRESSPLFRNRKEFEKDKRVNSSSLIGYFADVHFLNYSTKDIKMYSVGAEVSESSK